MFKKAIDEKARKMQVDCQRHGEQVKKLELKVRPFP